MIDYSAVEFRAVRENVNTGDASYALRYPHTVLDGVNHACYTTGNSTDRVDRFLIESEVSDEECRRRVAEATVPFIAFYSTVKEIPGFLCV